MKHTFRYTILNLILEGLVKRKKWHLAHFIIKITNFSDGNLDWLKTHVNYCSSTTREYKAYSRADMVSLRLSTLGYNYISSKTIYAGLINLGAIIHTAVDKQTNNKVKVFEKVYHPYRLQSVKQEELLFDEIKAEDLAAPGFKGSYTDGPFISMFYDFIERDSLTPNDKKNYKFELVKKLWSSRPTKKLLDNPHTKDSVGLLASKDCFDSMIEASNSEMDRRIIEYLQVNAKKIISEFRTLPPIIMHKDIFQPNIIKSKDEILYLIDWDKWCVSNVGAGLLIQTQELFNPILLRYINSIIGYQEDHLAPLDVLRNICIYNLTHHLHFKNYESAINWAYSYYNLTVS